MKQVLTFAVTAAMVLAVGCGDDDGPTFVDAGRRDAGARDAGTDAGRDAGPDAAIDAGPRDAAAIDANRPDASDCPSGQHICPGGCEPNRANEPANGCRLGCGAVTPCPAPANSTAVCSIGGECDFACNSGFRREGDRCVCTTFIECPAGMCGLFDDGCGGTQMCECGAGYACVSGDCECTNDEFEPNDSDTDPTMLDGNPSTPAIDRFVDAPDTDVTYREHNLYDADSDDWFEFRLEDEFDFGGAPVLEVTLADFPPSCDYDLFVYHFCDGGRTNTSMCTRGDADSTFAGAVGCKSDAVGTTNEAIEMDVSCDGDDDGRVYVHVQKVGSCATCDPYSLRVYAH